MTDKEEILQQRAKDLAFKIDAGPNAEDLLLLLEFSLGDERYGIEVNYVEEVRPFNNCTQLPNTPEFVVGVVNLRQSIVSVLSLRKILSIPEKECLRPKIIVLKKNEMQFSLLVDEVFGKKIISKSQIQSVPSTFTGLQKEILKGITNEKLIILHGEILFVKKDFIVNRELEA